METARLKQFKAIVECGGIIKAAELLGISGGGLSKSVKVLEDELGFALFAQKGRGVELTREGRLLYERLPGALSALENLLSLSKEKATAVETFKVTSFEVFTTYFLAAFLERLSLEKPCEVREAIPGRMEALVAEGKSDVGITYHPIPHPGLEFVRVGKIRMGIFGRRSVATAGELPFAAPLSPIEGSPSDVRGLDGWPDHLIKRDIRYRVDMLETAVQLCQRGTAVAFLPAFVVNLVNEHARPELALKEIPFPKLTKVYREVFLISRKGAEETREFRELAKALRRLN